MIFFSLILSLFANHLPVMYVQVPQWADDWAGCAVDVPDAKCHWYVMSPDNTFGEGFDWDVETKGGGFMHGGVVHKLRPTDFCIFDPRVPHAADEIISDDKRFALDFSVKKT